jgi:xanthine/uracil permease
MELTELRNLLVTATIIFVGLGAAFSFDRYTKREKYKALMESGQKINLNLVFLLAAFLRDKHDPLRPLHFELARVGFLYFFGMMLGIILLPTLIVATFMVLRSQ